MSTRYKASRRELAAVKSAARKAVADIAEVGKVLAELIRDRPANTCALCLRPSRNQVCARKDCHKLYQRLYHEDRQERRRALKGAR